MRRLFEVKMECSKSFRNPKIQKLIMKRIKFLTTVLLFAASFFIISCSSNSNQDNNKKTHGEGKAYTAAYVCPMHCEGSGSDEAGTCPVCNMDYVTQDEHIKDGHTH